MAKSSLMDKEFQSMAAIKGLYDSAGWKLYEEKLKDLYMYEKGQLDQLLRMPVGANQLPALNDHLSRLTILRIILSLKGELADEFSPSESEQNNSQTE